jgi:hypothetical protein
MTVTLIDNNRDREKEFETRAEAEEKKQDMIGLGASPKDLEIVATDETEETADANTTEVVETTPDGGQAATVANTQPDDVVNVPDEGPSLDENPTDWLPGHFIDEIQGVPTVNRKGYCMIASKYGVSVTAEPVTTASESGFEYAEFRAIATTEDGKEYSGFGSAHVDRQDGDDAHLLNELAETRALKRACAWATGIGLTAIEELKNEL